MLHLSGASNCVHESVDDNETCDSRGDDGRRGIRSQDTIHYYFHDSGESVDGDGRSGYRSQTSPYPSTIQASLLYC